VTGRREAIGLALILCVVVVLILILNTHPWRI